jgi:hypothetical protein
MRNIVLLFLLTSLIACPPPPDPIVYWVGEMVIDPEQIPADGQTAAEISIFVMDDLAGYPIQGIWITVESSRNQGGNVLDIIEQPIAPTDADGRAVAYLWSSTLGEAQFAALYSRSEGEQGAPLCSGWEAGECVPLRVLITFVE